MKEISAIILLIEDERQMRRFLRVALQSEKYGVIEAETAAEGLSQAVTRNPDIVFLDLGLPNMEGPRCYRKTAGMVRRARYRHLGKGTRKGIR